MKTPRIVAALVCVVFAVPDPTLAQDKSKTWEQRKAERLKPVSPKDQQAISLAIPDRATAKPLKPRRILVFYRCEGFIHTSIPHATYAVQAMAEKTGAFKVDVADSYDVFTDQNLAPYDAILLNNSSLLRFPEPAQANAFIDFVSLGKGLAGFHAASDNFNQNPKCRALVGGQFNGHPWHAGGTWAFKLDDPQHVLNRAFKGRGFWLKDEIYQYKPDSYQGTDQLRILVSLDMSKTEVSGRIDDGPREVPVSWLQKAGKGRVFYTNFGHNEATYQDPVIVRHMLDGIQYALGDLEADAVPTAELSDVEPAFAPSKT